MLLPSNPAQPASMMAQAFSIYKSMIVDQPVLGNTESSASKAGKEDPSSPLDFGEESSPTAKPDGDERLSAPIFSLQSTKDKK